ncbi:MAG: hypothetical protein Q8K82_01215 [Gemmatimonadaceae bacterium]|nr:hypothetical protein [Gemmatimonadaceae bacterium]
MGNVTYIDGANGTGAPAYAAGRPNVLSKWPRPTGPEQMVYAHDAAGNRTKWDQ